MSGQHSAIEARGLELTFQTADGPVHALSDVNLAVQPGDFVSFIGPSGCGKTTFLRVVADLERPTGGSIAVNGMSPEEARRARAYGYVFQAPGLLPWRTIEKNVRLPLEIMGYPKAEQADRARRTLELVGLADFARRFPWQLSGGMQQRASIARALAFDAGILLMDEPFGALDAQTRLSMHGLLLDVWQKHRATVLFVTHDVDEALLLADDVRVMSHAPGRLIRHYAMTEARPRAFNTAGSDLLDIREEILGLLRPQTVLTAT